MGQTVLKQVSAGATCRVFGVRPHPDGLPPPGSKTHIVVLDDREAQSLLTGVEDDFELVLSDGESRITCVATLEWTDVNDEHGRREYLLRLPPPSDFPAFGVQGYVVKRSDLAS